MGSPMGNAVTVGVTMFPVGVTVGVTLFPALAVRSRVTRWGARALSILQLREWIALFAATE